MKKINFTDEFLMSLPKSLDLAIINNSKYYYDSSICKNGHISPKIVNKNKCFLCKREETRKTAEKRRRKLGLNVQNIAKPLVPGEVYCQLTATGKFKSKITENRINNKRVYYHEVLCSCDKLLWIASSNWGKSKQCKECNLKNMHLNNITHGLSESIEGNLYYSAKIRANKSKIDFNISIEDIVIPERCPILNIIIDYSIGNSSNRKPRFNAPSIDRIDSSLGYIKGNIIVMSYKANVLKKDGSSDEHIKVADYMEKMGIIK